MTAPPPETSEPISVEKAYEFCTHLAETHYENFPVGRLVPRHLKKHVHVVYAFARFADDMADEGFTPGSGQTSSDDWAKNRAEGAKPVALNIDERLAALDDWQAQLCERERTLKHPVFVALHQTMDELQLPEKLFTDLISAFKQDVVKRRYPNFAEVLDYCRRSANPIGRLVLLLHDQRDPYQHELSDHICTALQLANFWQDVAVDIDKDRIYLPLDEMERYGVSEDDLKADSASTELCRLMRFQVDRTQQLFDAGEPLPSTLPGKLRLEIRLTWMGGTAILRKIEDQNYDTLHTRPRLGKLDFLTLLGQTLVNH